MARLPKKWTADEDATLRKEVAAQRETPLPYCYAHTLNSDSVCSGARPEGRDWCHIAEKLPGRTNKDCRKRWHNTMAGEFRKGLWTKQEDEQLKGAIAKHGTRWTIVANTVKSRSAEQCAKRWQHSLNPDLDRSEWTESEDQTLINAVEAIGRQWTQIQCMYFTERSKNAIKNRYTIVSRKLRRQAQIQEHEGRSPSGSPPGETDEEYMMEEDEGDSDRSEKGPEWSYAQSRPTDITIPTTLPELSPNKFDPMLEDAHFPAYDVPSGSLHSPWSSDPSQILTPSLVGTGSDPFVHGNDSYLDLMMTDFTKGSYSSSPPYPDSCKLDPSQLDCAMVAGEMASEIPGVPSIAGTCTNTVAIKLVLDDPDSETMQSLMRIAIEKKAKFLVERQ
ncbi:hypothetical protein BDW62DRAFT_203303 [Aspergillus aurantiobrunneus]